MADKQDSDSCVVTRASSSLVFRTIKNKGKAFSLPLFFMCRGSPRTRSSRSSRRRATRRSVRREKGPLDLFLNPPHPVFRHVPGEESETYSKAVVLGVQNGVQKFPPLFLIHPKSKLCYNKLKLIFEG